MYYIITAFEQRYNGIRMKLLRHSYTAFTTRSANVQ